ncbi:MAG: hypothetical protein OQK82_00290 [Candidatus Pacearchaeota archaeon]|nr:hypothetical protein [Candidatus Pacearchaeota archaeon]
MNKNLSVFFVLMLLPFCMAMDIDLKKYNSEAVMVQGFDNPAVFNLKITNEGLVDTSVNFLNFLGFVIEPESIRLEHGKSKDIEFKIYPKDNFDYLGYYIFKYSIFKGEERIDDELLIKIIEFEDAFSVGGGEIDPDSNSLEVYIENEENFEFSDLHVKFSSVFFDFEEDFSLEPFERKAFSVELNKEDFKRLMAGFYTFDAVVFGNDESVSLEGVIKFNEKDVVTSEKKEFGFVIASKIITKENQGNVIVNTNTTLKKNIVSRIFTSFNVEPDAVEREGFDVYYMWESKINPGETLEIIVKTNWLFPFALVLIIVGIVVGVNRFSKKHLVVKKSVSFVKSKGGEFAMKVTLRVHARKYVEKIRLVDRLPPLVKIYEKFGIEKPIRIDEKAKRVEWAFEKLEAGETRVVSYIIYSKVAVLGRFVLPSSVVLFERNGKLCKSVSNKSFLMAEQSSSGMK